MKGICKVSVLIALVLAAVSMAGTVSFAQEKVITLRYSNMFPPTDPLSLVGDQWGKEVEKRTNGRVKVRYYPGSALNSPVQTYESIGTGVIDIGNVMLGYTRGRFPFFSGLWENPWEYDNAQQATKIANAAFAKFKPKELDDVKIMYFHCTTDAMLHTVKKQVVKLDDLKGLKIRTMDSNAAIMTSLGAAPVGMPQAEVYDALSKGVLDGAIAVYSGLKTWKTADILRYTTELNGSAYTAVFAVAMNKDKWNSIAPADQKVIEQLNLEWAQKQALLWDTLEKEGKEYAISRGVKVIKLSAQEQAKWNAMAKPLYDEYLKRTKEKNLPGDELLKFVRENMK
jgi:TRAP-type C4-dicarboxylate transport system substrate-binding protein